MDAGLPRGTVTFLFSDIEGSTELARRHGAAYGDLRAEHRRVLREVLQANRGREIDSEGDAFFIGFERASDAVAAAVAVQRALSSTSVVRVRIGLHTTEPHLHADGYVGVGVSRAARICGAATVDRSCCLRRPRALSRMTSYLMFGCATVAITI